jgi:peptidoglycan hydrolase CwlO-like protein
MNADWMRLEAKMDKHQEKMDVLIADMKDGRKERMACQEATEANPEKREPKTEESESVPELQEVPTVHATVRYSGAPNKRRRGREEIDLRR